MPDTRYDRQIKLQGFGAEGQRQLRASRILMVGAGGLGVPACLYLNAMGVGTLGIVDGDVIEASNLHRQPAYGEADVGRPKAEVLAATLRAQNPDTRINLHPTFLVPSNALEILEGYDLVVDATDRIPTRYLLDDACVIRQIPWVYGALHGFEGQVSVFNHQEGPTYRCLFPKIPRPGEIPDCNRLGTLGVLPGIIGTLQALEAVKVVCGIGEVLSGRLLLFNALEQESRHMRFERNHNKDETRQIHEDAHYHAAQCDTRGAIGVPQYLERTQSGKANVLVDVRETDEFAAFHLPGARNIPLMQLEASMDEVAGYPEVYFICKSGSRSAQAFRSFRARHPRVNAWWILHGMEGWKTYHS